MDNYDDDGDSQFRFELSIEFNGDGSLDITLGGVVRDHIGCMFSTSIADVITTTLMDLETRVLHGEFDDEDDDG